MDQDQEKLLAELLVDFRIEAAEHYEAIVNGLILLERESDPAILKSAIEKIFRVVHSLKGAARAVNLLSIEKLCSAMENVFNSLKKGETVLSKPMLDLFHKAADELNLLLSVNANPGRGNNYNLNQLLKNFEFILRNNQKQNDEDFKTAVIVSAHMSAEVNIEDSTIEQSALTSEVTGDAHEISESADFQKQTNLPIEIRTVRISTDKLYDLLQQSEEMLSLKATLEYYSLELQSLNLKFSKWNNLNGQLRTDDLNIRELDKNFRNQYEDELNSLAKGMNYFCHSSSKMVDELLHSVKTALLLPFASILNAFPKIIRDLGKEYSKEINVLIEGEKIEIDKRILEEMKDPLIHLIRNCIDHGIETPKVRIGKGKTANGTISIKITQELERKIAILINDDGAGMNKERIVSSAIKAGILRSGEVEKFSDQEIYALIFSSGVSSSQFITDLSGRGLGMAIVAEKVTKLGGSIDFETKKDAGTSFIVTLPQTLSTFRGILVKSADQSFIIPSFALERTIRVKYSEIKTVSSRQTISYKNDTIALALLSDILKNSGSTRKKGSEEFLQVLILNISQKRLAIVVDEIAGEHEGIVKDLGRHIIHIQNISGVTILGSGKAVLILNPLELIESAINSRSTFSLEAQDAKAEETAKPGRILLAEDSVTIRTLLRNFIENAGYSVKTSVDGMEAFQVLQNEEFDLVVSDVEMPRMNGFELTAKIRKDKNYSDLPVILVTALESAEDKQRGMEAGANAYITKSSFEKSNLIDAIKRLI